MDWKNIKGLISGSLGQHLAKAKQAGISGVSSISAAASSRVGATGINTNILNSKLRTGFAHAVRFGVNHPGVIGGAIGGVGGYVGSGGEWQGALMGAGIGAIGGGSGWAKYDPKSTGFGRTRNIMASKLGKQISKIAPNFASAYATGPARQRITRAQQPRKGHMRNMGGKTLGAMGVGAGVTLGAGALGGLAYSAASNVLGNTSANIGRTFGNQTQAIYGNAFSGMGNGTVTGY